MTVVTVGHGKCQVPARATRCPGRSNQLFVEVFRVGLAASVSVHSGDANLGQECLPAGLFSAGTGTSQKNSGGSRHQHLSLLDAVSTWPTPSCSFHFMPFVENQQAWRPAMPSGILRDAMPELSTDSWSMLVNSSGSAEWSYGAQSTEAGRRCRRLHCLELQQLQLQLRPLQAGRRPVRRPVRPMLVSVLYLCPVGRPCRDHKGIEMSRDMMRDDQF